MSFRKKKKLDPALQGVELQTDEVIRQGWLHKQGHHFRSWKKRWMVLNRAFLLYFKSAAVKDSTQPQGVIKVQDIFKVEIAEVTKKKKYGFEVHTKKRVYPMAADSASVRKAWIVSINRAIEENRAMRERIKKSSAQVHRALVAGAVGGGKSRKTLAPPEPWEEGQDEDDMYDTGTMVIVRGKGGAGQYDDEEFDSGTMIINRTEDDDDEDDYYNAGTMVYVDSDDDDGCGTMVRMPTAGPSGGGGGGGDGGGAKPSFLRYVEENQVVDDDKYLGREEGKDPSKNWEGFTVDELNAFAGAIEKQREREITHATAVYENLRIAILEAISDKTD